MFVSIIETDICSTIKATIMRRSLLLLSVPVLLATACQSNKQNEATLYSQQMVESHGLGDFYCNKNHQENLAEAPWDYVSGLVANSVLKAWEMYPDHQEYYDAVKAFADKSTNEDGSMIFNKKGGNALRPSNIDDLPAGNIYFTLYKEELKKGNQKDAERYKNAATMIRNKLKYEHSRIAEGLPGAGGFFHKATYPNQMWLDGLYMGSTIYAQWQHVFGNANPEENQESWTDIAHQFKTIHQYTYNAEKQLNYQGCMAINAGDNNLIRDVRFEDIRVENFREGQLLNLRIFYNKKYCAAPGRGIENVLFKDITYNGDRANLSIIEGYNEERTIRNIRFENLRINGELITDAMPGKPRWYQTGDMARIYVGPHVEGVEFVETKE